MKKKTKKLCFWALDSYEPNFGRFFK